MEESVWLNSVLGICFTLGLACLLFLIAKRVKFIPYTVILVIAGIILVHFDLPQVETIRLTPDSVFFFFLPILLFESAYNFDFREFKRILAPGFLLASLGLIVSAIIIALPLFYLFEIPFAYAFLFGSVISSTDPIAVLSLFKQLGVPKRLQLLVDGESFLNDATSVIMYKIMLGFATGTVGVLNATEVFKGLGSFVYVFLGGLLVGTALGWLFSELIYRIKNVSSVEIALTLILAHISFIIGEEFFGVSGIITVLAAGLVLGNYGRTKISPKVVHTMHQMWDFLVFVSTSLIFFLIGYEIKLDELGENINIIIVSTLALLLGRAVSVYLFGGIYNLFTKVSNKIPLSWMHIANWGGLRGALPLIVILSLETSDPYRDLFLQLVVGAILFTLLVNATTVAALIRLLRLDCTNQVNDIEVKVTELFVLRNLLKRFKKLLKFQEISECVYQKNVEEINARLQKDKETIQNWIESKNEAYKIEFDKVLRRYCLQIEKAVYSKLFRKELIPEVVYSVLKRNILYQIEKLNEGQEQFTDFTNTKIKARYATSHNAFKLSLLERLVIGLNPDITFEEKLVAYNYKYHKARLLGDEEVIKELEGFLGDELLPEKVIRGIILLYTELVQYNLGTLNDIEARHARICERVQNFFARKESENVVEGILEEFGEEERISTKSLQVFNLDINHN